MSFFIHPQVFTNSDLFCSCFVPAQSLSENVAVGLPACRRERHPATRKHRRYDAAARNFKAVNDCGRFFPPAGSPAPRQPRWLTPHFQAGSKVTARPGRLKAEVYREHPTSNAQHPKPAQKLKATPVQKNILAFSTFPSAFLACAYRHLQDLFKRLGAPGQ